MNRIQADSAARLSAAVNNSRLLVLGAGYALLLLLWLRTGQSLSMTSAAGIVAWGIQALPLLALLPGLHKARPRGYAWLGFVIQLYFIHGVILAFNPPRFGWGLAQILLSVVIFSGLIAFIRRYRRQFQEGP